MSMLARKGTMVRKNRGQHSRNQSVKRTSSHGGSTKRQTPAPTPTIVVMDSTDLDDKESPMPVSPGPAKNVVGSMVSYNDDTTLYKTTVDWTASRVSVQSNYEAVFVQIKEATKEAESSWDFLCRSLHILTSTRFYTLLLAVSTALPMAMMTAGVKYLHDCPKQPKIPVYLLVGGCFGILKLIYTVWYQIQQRRYDSLPDLVGLDPADRLAFTSRSYRLMDSLLIIFLVSWLCTGTYWVFDIWKPNFEQQLHDPNNWCSKTVYCLAAFQILGCFCWAGITVIVLIGLLIAYKCRQSRATKQTPTTNNK